MKIITKIVLAGCALAILAGCQSKSASSPSRSEGATSDQKAPQGGDPSGNEIVSGALQADVQLVKKSYHAGDKIEITAVSMNLTESSWIGVWPASVPHRVKLEESVKPLQTVSLEGNTEPLATAPSEPGDYEIRLYQSTGTESELASRGFTVEP